MQRHPIPPFLPLHQGQAPPLRVAIPIRLEPGRDVPRDDGDVRHHRVQVAEHGPVEPLQHEAHPARFAQPGPMDQPARQEPCHRRHSRKAESVRRTARPFLFGHAQSRSG